MLQASLDYIGDTIVAGAAMLHALPPTNALINKDVEYDHVYADWKYGTGTIYLAFVHSNNITASAVSKTAGTILPNVGGYNAGTNPDLAHFYNIWQVSGDYNVTPQLRVGALWGRIVDTPGRDQGADGGSVGAYYASLEAHHLAGADRHDPQRDERRLPARRVGRAAQQLHEPERRQRPAHQWRAGRHAASVLTIEVVRRGWMALTATLVGVESFKRSSR